MDAPAHILLVDDDESLRRVTSYHLAEAGFLLSTASSGEEALEILEAGAPSPDASGAASTLPDLIITDVRMPGMGGLELLRRVRSRWPGMGVIVITAHGSIESAVEAMREGAHDYLVKPFDHEVLLISVEKVMRLTQLIRENERLRELARSRLEFDRLVAGSAPMREVLEVAAQVAPRSTTVLLLGESGTGKELLARAIHHASSRSDGPFVAVGVGALAEGLIDSELFGHRRGAFTGASSDRKGKFELAHGGTLFLDEIGDLRLDLQVKLLRALQEGEVDPLGADHPVTVDTRVIAATNRDLEAMVRDGTFREDLYYRLAVVPIQLPPLRDRRDEIPALVQHLIEKHVGGEGDARSGAHGPGRAGGSAAADPPPLTPSALAALEAYDWPGNVRELENVVERALALHREGEIGVDLLPQRVQSHGGADEAGLPDPIDLLARLPEEGLDLERLEREVLRRALEKCGGNQSRTARYLNITRNTLIYRLEKHGLR